jgi:hypothetical protein
MQRDELQRVLDWTNARLKEGAEPPWSWYQHMKLREALEAIISELCPEVRPQTADSPTPAQQKVVHLRQAGRTDS